MDFFALVAAFAAGLSLAASVWAALNVAASCAQRVTAYVAAMDTPIINYMRANGMFGFGGKCTVMKPGQVIIIGDIRIANYGESNARILINAPKDVEIRNADETRK